MTNKNILSYLVGLLVFVSFAMCNSPQTTHQTTVNTNQDSVDFAFKTKLKHAKGFTVTNHDTYKEIYVYHPLTGDTMGRYITCLNADDLPDNVKAKGQVIEVPAKTIACLSTTDVGCIEVLDVRDALIGCGSPEYVWDKQLQEKIKKGEIQEIGRGMGFNLEKIVSIMPNLLMQNFMDKTDVDGNLTKLGINVLYNNAWKEHSLLGRAEWLKFAALFFCKERKADSIFNKVEQEYYNIKAAAAKTNKKPRVMYGFDYKGTWYLPQNGTYVAQTIRDANVLYL